MSLTTSAFVSQGFSRLYEFDLFDLWETPTEEQLARLLDLEQIIKVGADEYDDKYEFKKVSFKVAPRLFIRILKKLSKDNNITMSKFQRLTTKHGLLILQASSLWKDLQTVIADAEDRALNQGDDIAAYNLEQGMEASFMMGRPYRNGSSLSVFRWVDGALGEIVIDTQLPMYYFAIMCSLISLWTYSDLGSFRDTAEKEIAQFIRTFEERIDKLSR